MIKSKLTNKAMKELEMRLLSFKIRETRRGVADDITYMLKSYLHWENMLLILIEKALKDKNYQIVNLLTNKMVMKAVSQGLTGTATKDDVLAILSYFNDEPIFKAFVKHSKENLNGHNCSMIVERVKAQRKEISKRRDLYFTNRAAYIAKYVVDGEPQYQKPKKLSKAHKYALPMDLGKWSIVGNRLGLTFGKRQIKRYINTKVLYLRDKQIKSVNVSMRHGQVYYNFSYATESLNEELPELPNVAKDKNKPKKVVAGLDVGINNLMALFICNSYAQSIIINGKRLKHYNSRFNRKIAKLKTERAKEVVKVEIRKDKNGNDYEEPIEYSERGVKLGYIIGNLFEARHRYFDDQLNKYSKKVVEYLRRNRVTDLVISKNLSFTKFKGSIKMQKGSKQNFYQIPFGKFLYLIETKAKEYAIETHIIDEAYTSKTSCLSSDVNLIQAMSKSGEKITSKDLNGSRGGVSRGLYKDSLLNKAINADLNGAANHIKVYFGDDVDLSVFRDELWKLCNPISIKSASEFDELLNKNLSNNNAKRKITCDIGLFKLDDQVCLV